MTKLKAGHKDIQHVLGELNELQVDLDRNKGSVVFYFIMKDDRVFCLHAFRKRSRTILRDELKKALFSYSTFIEAENKWTKLD
jgi:phage-related protein